MAARYADVVTHLISAGADVNYETPIGLTPLFVAVRAGNVAAVEALLEKGASVHAQSTNGRTIRGDAQSLDGERGDSIRALLEDAMQSERSDAR